MEIRVWIKHGSRDVWLMRKIICMCVCVKEGGENYFFEYKISILALELFYLHDKCILNPFRHCPMFEHKINKSIINIRIFGSLDHIFHKVMIYFLK